MSIKVNRVESEQEIFWKGEFGDDYIERNKSIQLLGIKTAFYGEVLNKMDKIDSCIEFGSNIGLNLLAIKRLLPECELSAIEINEKAVKSLEQIKKLNIYHMSILDFKPDYVRDLAFIHGVLIHIDPAVKKQIYKKLYETSRKYILLAEYYNPKPVELDYRGAEGKLFKADFAGEMMDLYPDLNLVDYGFIYHRDNQFPMDDLTWFLLEKKSGGSHV